MQTNSTEQFSNILDVISKELNNQAMGHTEIEYADAIKIYNNETTNEDGEFQTAWIQIYAPICGIGDNDFSKVAIYNTPDHPFGADIPEEVFSVTQEKEILAAIFKLGRELNLLKEAK